MEVHDPVKTRRVRIKIAMALSDIESQRQLAQFAGISPKTLVHLLQGAVSPDIRTLDSIAAVLQQKRSWIEGEGSARDFTEPVVERIPKGTTIEVTKVGGVKIKSMIPPPTPIEEPGGVLGRDSTPGGGQWMRHLPALLLLILSSVYAAEQIPLQLVESTKAPLRTSLDKVLKNACTATGKRSDQITYWELAFECCDRDTVVAVLCKKNGIAPGELPEKEHATIGKACVETVIALAESQKKAIFDLDRTQVTAACLKALDLPPLKTDP